MVILSIIPDIVTKKLDKSSKVNKRVLSGGGVSIVSKAVKSRRRHLQTAVAVVVGQKTENSCFPVL